MTTKDKKIIEDSERDGIPIFVFTAKDRLSKEILETYQYNCNVAGCNMIHVNEISDRIDEFEEWQLANKNKVKLPD